MSVHIAPTLRTMSEIYALSREGGPRSPRFVAYVARVEHEWGLSAFNPMAGPGALESVRALSAIDAERLAEEAARSVAARCEFEGELTMAIAVASKGMWTDRLATEIHHRTGPRPRHGIVLLWAGDILDAESVHRECVAEAVRDMWTALHGSATELGAVLAREGLAYALGGGVADATPRAADPAVEDAIAILGHSSTLGDIAGVLYGDPACAALGWTPLGLADHSGYRWAIDRATRVIAQAGPRDTLRLLRRLPDSGFDRLA